MLWLQSIYIRNLYLSLSSISVFHRFNQLQIKHIQKNSWKFQKHNLILPHASDDLHSIYILFGTFY